MLFASETYVLSGGLHIYLDISSNCSYLCVGVPALFPLHTQKTLEDSKTIFLCFLALNSSVTTVRER